MPPSSSSFLFFFFYSLNFSLYLFFSFFNLFTLFHFFSFSLFLLFTLPPFLFFSFSLFLVFSFSLFLPTAWILSNKVFEEIVGESIHQDLVSKSAIIFVFLGHRRALTEKVLFRSKQISQNIFLIFENDHSKVRVLVHSRLENHRILVFISSFFSLFLSFSPFFSVTLSTLTLFGWLRRKLMKL